MSLKLLDILDIFLYSVRMEKEILKKKIYIVALTASVLFLSACLSVEKAKYTVVKSHPDFEIRYYEPQVQAQTVVKGDFSEAGSKGFRLLADYIFAKKRGGQDEIAMTVPVVQVSHDIQSEKTLVKENNGAYTIGFVMPGKYRLKDLPQPEDKRVSLVEIPSRKVAAISYTGTWSQENYKEHEKKLMSALKIQGIEVKGTPEWARYNPPSTPWFLRNNEVIVEIK